MNIALIGAPGAGKTKLATKLIQEIPNTNMVDGYVEQLESSTGRLYGKYATYIGNVHIGLHRAAWESQMRSKADNTITCGTLVESIVWNGLAAAKGPANEQNYHRTRISMEFLGMVLGDTWDYDLSYLLPLEEEGDRWTSRVDEDIPECIKIIGVPYTSLVGSFEEKVDKVMSDVKEKGETPTSNGKPVQGSEREGKTVGSGPGHMPDVPEQADPQP